MQHLAIRYRVHPTGISGRDPVDILHDLSHLTQLRSLKVEAPDAGHGLVGMKHFPESLTSLCVGGWEETGMSINLRSLDPRWRQESECLRRLANLEFHLCCMHIGVHFTAILLGLTSLRISESEADRCIDAVLKLTNLISLDLTGVMHRGGLCGTPWLEGQQPWSTFVAWPALHVFKFAGCWLTDKSTALDIATVQEVHTDRLALGMGTANIHLVLRDNHTIMLGSLASLLSPAWCTHIVGLHIIVTDTPDAADLHLACHVKQVLEALLCLQSFYLVGGYDWHGQSGDYRQLQGQMVLGDGYSGQLKDLKLQDLFYHTLDLGVATCLTSIGLSNIGQSYAACELVLPSCVVRLEVVGSSLTTRHAKHVLEGLSSLTHVSLGTRRGEYGKSELSSSASLPTMPGSLQWLSVTSKSLKKLLDGSAQDCLRFCTSLEYLILPLGQYPKGHLYKWVRSARYVQVSDNDPEEIVWWRDEYYI